MSGPERAQRLALRSFRQLLANTIAANVTAGSLWFALVFWVYLETRSGLAASLLGGGYMLASAVAGVPFGLLVDRAAKRAVLLGSSAATLAAFLLAGALFLASGEVRSAEPGDTRLWLFVLLVLLGAIAEQLRNIALPALVTLLVPADGRDRANGAVGTVQGVVFLVTSAVSGVAIGFAGMGATLLFGIVASAATTAHLLFVRIPGDRPVRRAPRSGRPRGAGVLSTVRSVPGLSAMILFSAFNNLIGGVFVALMDPYGLTLFPVELWGLVMGATSAGFIVGGLLVTRFGLGRAPVRVVLLANLGIACTGLGFTLRELGWLFALGLLFYCCLVPYAEAAEQTVVQRLVPYERQGRVFGLATSVESAAAPLTAFLVGPLAEFWLLPFAASEQGAALLEPLLGSGRARGIALVFTIASAIMLAAVLLAFVSTPYRRLARAYAFSFLSDACCSEYRSR